ncbi:MAG: creatininase family protein [Planctomycetaceae bacterium]|nr:creatininase family protein [Planctomycetaceae bacterium]
MKLHEMTWREVDQLSRTTPVVFPVAALEQHGHHMPLFTDSLLLGEVVRRVEQQPVASNVLFAPLQWLGNSHHHLDMPGTVSASPRVYLDLLRDQAECLLHHGFQRILFLNGHGGNAVPAQQALFELRQKYRQRNDLLLCSLTYWDAACPDLGAGGLQQPEMGHAGEWETSMMLALRPDLVQGEVASLPNIPFGQGAAPGYRGWTMPDRSLPGHIGVASAASREKGDLLFATFAKGVTTYLERLVAWSGKAWDL